MPGPAPPHRQGRSKVEEKGGVLAWPSPKAQRQNRLVSAVLAGTVNEGPLFSQCSGPPKIVCAA